MGGVETSANVLYQVQNTLFFFNQFRYQNMDRKHYMTLVFKRVSLEVLGMLKVLENSFSFLNLKQESPFFKSNDFESDYQLAPFSTAKLTLSSLIILISINTRYESYVLNLNLRQRFFKGNFNLFVIGPQINLTTPTKQIGANFKTLISISEGVHSVCQTIYKSELPLFLTNSSFFRNPHFNKLSEMLSVIQKSCLSLGSLSVLSDRLETSGIYNINRFNHMTPDNFLNSKIVLYLNSDFQESVELKSTLNHSVLKTGCLKVEEKIFIEQTDAMKSLDVFAPSQNFNSRHFPYIQIPSKNFFEDSSTFLNTNGEFKKSVRVHDNSNNKTNWEILRQIQRVSRKSIHLANFKDNKLIGGCVVDQFKQKSCSTFLYKATQSITTMSFELDANSNVFELSNFVKPEDHKFKFSKTFFRFSKLKYWFDDFFVGGNKDMLSMSSSTLIKCSKSVRLSTTNFF